MLRDNSLSRYRKSMCNNVKKSINIQNLIMECTNEDINSQQRNENIQLRNQISERNSQKGISLNPSAQHETIIDNADKNMENETQGPTVDGDLDPRIQIELEKLNSSTDVINKLELDLEEARSTFRHLLGESGRQLNQLYKEQGTSVEKARCYYDARMKARAALSEAQRAAARFEKASSAHDAAKEMVTLAEEGFMERGVVHFDQAWQEMLNHATKRVNDSEVERNLSAEEHRVKSKAYQNAEQKVIVLQRSLKRSINKSRPYFEAKARLNQSLDDQKRQIQLIEETIQMTKVGYADSLKQLEKISEEIHERRRKESSKILDRSNHCEHESSASLGIRQDGVGAEFPSPYSGDKKLVQIPENTKESHSIKTDKTKNINSKRQPESDSFSGYHIRESQNMNSDSDTNDPEPLVKNAACDEIDSLPLIGDLQVSKNYNYMNSKKYRKKKNKKLQPESLPDVSHESKLKKKAINQSMKIKQSTEITQNDSEVIEQKNNEPSSKRISISSSSTTESAGNDGTSATASINSNNSRTSSRETISSSSNVSSSSESLSPQQSPKLIYKRLTSTESVNFKAQVLSKQNSSSNKTAPSTRLGTTDLEVSNENNAEILESPIISPLKKHLYSPSKLTNKYLSIKQEESEMSDAESLASLDPLDDSQIDQLMKEDSLRAVADDIFKCAEDQADSKSNSIIHP